MNYYENYTKQFKALLTEYENMVAKQKKYTENYMQERKDLFKDIEDKINNELNKLQCLTVTDIYFNTNNQNIPQMYWNIYVLWLEKMKLVYQLDNEYMKSLMSTANPMLQLNPFFNTYNLQDLYKYFNIKDK